MTQTKRLMWLGAALWASLWSCSGLLAADLVVDNLRGSDFQNDRGLLPMPGTFGPYRTIARALAATGPGDRVILTKTGVPYRECISLNGVNHSGTLREPFTIVGNGAVLDGSEAPHAMVWESQQRHSGLWKYQRTPPGFSLLLLPAGRLQRVQGSGGPVPLLQLAPLSWTRQNGQIYLRTEDGLAPGDYPLQLTVQTTGITLYDVEHVVISDLTVRGFRIDGINAHDRAVDVRISGVTAIENGRSGISVGGASRVRLENSRVGGNGEAQIRTEGRSILTLSDVQADPVSAAAIEQDGGQVIGQTTPPDQG